MWICGLADLRICGLVEAEREDLMLTLIMWKVEFLVGRVNTRVGRFSQASDHPSGQSHSFFRRSKSRSSATLTWQGTEVDENTVMACLGLQGVGQASSIKALVVYTKRRLISSKGFCMQALQHVRRSKVLYSFTIKSFLQSKFFSSMPSPDLLTLWSVRVSYALDGL